MKSSTDATSNEVMEADDDKVEQKLRLNLSLLFNLIYKAITGVKIIFYSNFKYDHDYVVPMYLPSCFPTPDAQYNKYTLSALTLLHIFGKNTRMGSPTARSIHYLHCFHHQLHIADTFWDKTVRFKRCHFYVDEAEKTPGAISFPEPTLPDRWSR